MKPRSSVPSLRHLTLLLLGVTALGAAEGLLAEAPEPTPALPQGVAAFAQTAPEPNAPEAIGISEWTRSAGPDESVVVAGWGFDDSTRFKLLAQGADAPAEATIRTVDAHRAVVTLPADLPETGLILLWPEGSAGSGAAVPINHAELWYTIPRKAEPGERISVFGRNLATGRDAPAWVLLREKGGSGAGVLLAAEASNPYKVDVTVPDDLALGEYEVYLHNGLGGDVGWAALHARHGGVVANSHLTLREAPRWSGPTFDVRELGAKGDGATDDTEAILAALAKANATPRSTIHFPAGTYLISKPIAPVQGPDKTGVRITGDGMKRTFIKGNPENLPKQLLVIDGADVEVRDLVLDINYLGEEEKHYRDFVRPEHDVEDYRRRAEEKKQRDAEKRAAKKAEQERKKKLKAWKRDQANKGKPIPDELKPPPKQEKPKRPKRPSPGRVIEKKGWDSGTRFVNCVIDAERWTFLLKGLSDAVIENCDIVAKEAIITCPKFTRIERCNFFARADAPVMMYAFGGWCNAITHNTGRDYMPNTYDTAMGRFYTVSAYGNRTDNAYIAHNQTFDLTVQPGHYNQNSGEQIMWEFLDPITTQQPTAVTADSVTFAEQFKNDKIKWYSTAMVVDGKGMGQYRQIQDYDPKTGLISLMRPWRVRPDTDSKILICRSVNRQVVYDNQLDAKPRAYQSEGHIASAGVEPFGTSFDLIVDGNTFTEIRSGLAIMGVSYNHLYQHNVMKPARWGMRLPDGGRVMNIVARHNTMEGVVVSGIRVGSRYGKGELGANAVFEHNRVIDTPVAMEVGNQRKTAGSSQLVSYRNLFKLGAAAADGAAAYKVPSEAAVMAVDDTVEGYPTIWSETAGGK